MRERGMIGNPNIVERIVRVEDTKKMEEFEQRLEKEKQDIRKNAEEEKKKIE